MEQFKADQICNVEGNGLAYRRDGHGEPLVLIHGITTYGFIWRNMAPALAQKFDVIVLDLLGCGNSDKPLDASYSLKSHSRRLKKFMDLLDIKKAHFVCHDVGGGVGQIFAVNYPDRIMDLTLINTVAYDFWPVQPIIVIRTPIIRQLAMATLDMGALNLIVKRGVFHKDRVTPGLIDYFWDPMKTRIGRKAFLLFAKGLDNQDLLEITQDLKHLTIPVMIIRGDADVYLSLEITKKLHREIPGSKLVRIASGGHLIQEDEPEQLVAEILKFIEENNHAARA